MKNTTSPYIIVGKFGSSFGVKGWIKVVSYTEFGPAIFDYQPWFLIGADNTVSQLPVEGSQVQAKGLIVKLANINTPEEARLLTGKTISILRSELPVLKKDEYYWSDLEGLTVINKDGAILGKVAFLMETGSNDVLVVKGEKEFAIPYLPGDVILSIDLAKQEIHVDWEII